jgi:hypothetical protein
MEKVEEQILDEKTGVEARLEVAITKAERGIADTLTKRTEEFNTSAQKFIAKVDEDTALLENATKTTVDTMTTGAEKFESDLKRLSEESYQLGLNVGKFRALVSVLRVMRGEEPDLTEYTIALVSMLESAQSLYDKKNRPSIVNSISSLRGALVKEF